MSESPNKTKHTPGPWEATNGRTQWNIRPIGGRPMRVANTWHGNPEERAANARLIASAPELLRELKSALCFIESFKDHEETLAAHEVYSRFAASGNWGQVQAIVAKAEGKD